jgi:antitoxin Phd
VKTWPVQDARARFSEMLDACLKRGAQLVTKRGTEAAVLVPIEEWRRLHGAPVRTLKELLLTDEGRGNVARPAFSQVGAALRCA